MPLLRIPGCTGKFSEKPGAEKFVLANYKTMSMREMAVATGVAYHNVAGLLERRKLMANRYTTKRRTIELAKKMSSHELAYLAGIIDGEGTLTIQHRCPNGRMHFRPYVTISNTSNFLRDWLAARGYNTHLTTNSSGRPYWRLNWSGFGLSEFLPLVAPYLIIKKRHALLILEFISIRRSQSKKALPTARMLEIVSVFKWLNERGLPLEERERRDALSTL